MKTTRLKVFAENTKNITEENLIKFKELLRQNSMEPFDYGGSSTAVKNKSIEMYHEYYRGQFGDNTVCRFTGVIDNDDLIFSFDIDLSHNHSFTYYPERELFKFDDMTVENFLSIANENLKTNIQKVLYFTDTVNIEFNNGQIFKMSEVMSKIGNDTKKEASKDKQRLKKLSR